MPLRNLIVILLAALLSMACYVRASRNRYVSTITEAMNLISTEYVDDVEQRKLFEGAMDGMVGQLDPYSGYSPPEEYQQFRDQMDQGFVGIGVFVELDQETKRLTIMSPLVGTPAHKAGIKSGDVILAIDGKDTAGMSLKESTSHIKGPAGTKVKLTIQHIGEPSPVDLLVERAEIPIESVYGDIRGADGKWIFHLLEKPKLGYIRVHNFGERTPTEVRTALDAYKQTGQGIEALILDLRGNAGGLLTSAIGICDMFLDRGTIVSTRGRNNQERSRHVATKGMEVSPDIPLVVMVDRFSASASEIVAACLQDNRRAVVVGQRSWGKGTVQNIVELEGGRSALRLTIARYWRPSGKDIHKAANAQESDDWGVSPDPGLEVNLTSEEFETWVKARRQRDIMTFTGQAHTTLTQPSGEKARENNQDDQQPMKPEENEPAFKEPRVHSPQDISPAPPADKPGPKANRPDPASYDDPQLRKAIDYLEERLRQATAPRPA